MPFTQTQTEVILPTDKIVRRNYRFVLYESNLYNEDVHPVIGTAQQGIHTKVGDLIANNKKLNLTLNKPGSASFTLPSNSDLGNEVIGHEIIRCIIIFCDDRSGSSKPLWSGYIAKAQPAGEAIEVTCVGWAQLLYEREMRRQYTFVSQDAGELAFRLLGTANRTIANGEQESGILKEDLLNGIGDFEETPPIIYNSFNIAGNPGEFANTQGLEVTPDWDWAYYDPGWPILPSGARCLRMGNIDGLKGNFYITIARVPVTAFQVYNLAGLMACVDRNGASSKVGCTISWADAGSFALGQDIIEFTDLDVLHEFLLTVAAPFGAVTASIGCHVIVPGGSGPTIYTQGIFESLVFCKQSFYDGFNATVGRAPTPIVPGDRAYPANPGGANRSRTYQRGQNIGQALEELSQIEGGFDWDVTAVRRGVSNGVVGGETYDRRLNIYYHQVKTGTTIYGQGYDRPNVIFGYRAGAKNLRNVGVEISAEIKNRMNAYGVVGNAVAQDLVSIRKYGLHESSVQISDTGIADNVLLAYAGAEVAFFKDPVIIYTPDLLPFNGKASTYLYGVDYSIGDIVYFQADLGYLEVGSTTGSQPVRLFGLQIAVDDNGNELISNIQTTAK